VRQRAAADRVRVPSHLELEQHLASKARYPRICSILSFNAVCRHSEQLLKFDDSATEATFWWKAESAECLRLQGFIRLCSSNWKAIYRREDKPAATTTAEYRLDLTIVGHENCLTLLTMREERISTI
jgi:hypothetical protein